MKRSIFSILVVALLLTAMAGCGRTENNEVTNPTPPVSNDTVRPEDNNGVVEDDNGIIGDSAENGDRPNSGIVPEIGSDIEQGANDVINGVEDAIEGSDNNAASGNTNSDAGDNARGRIRMR